MADKEVIIGIKTTGGQQAAAEVAKVDAALDGMAKQIPKVTAAGLNMRSTISNVGYQVQDFAVQVGMGTSAIRAFSQQAPQLLSAFGPWGIVAGTAIALGAPLASALMAGGEAAGDAADEMDDLTEVMEDYAEAAKKAAIARDVEALEDWFDGLDAEEEKIAAVNEQREKEIELLLKTRALKEGIDKARGDLARAEIEADPNMSESDKIRAQAELEEREKRAAADAKIQALVDAADKAEREAKAAEEKRSRELADLYAAQEEVQNINSARERNEEQGKILQTEVPALEKQLQAAKAAQARAINPETGETLPGYAEAEGRAEDLQSRIAALRAAAGDPTKKAATLEAQLEVARKKQAEQEDQAKKADAEDTAARANSNLARRALEEQQPLIEGEFGVRRDEIRVRTEAKLREQAERETRERERAAEAAAREAEGTRGAAGKAGRAAERLIPKDASDELRNAIRAVSAGLQDGDQGGELKELAALMKELATAVQGQDAARSIEIEQLRSQIANLRKGGK